MTGVGEVIGCIIYGFLADRFGRKFSWFLSAGIMFVAGMMSAFSFHPYMSIVARLLMGTSTTGMYNIGFLMGAELFPPKQRTFFSTGGEMMWSLGVTSMALIGYFIRDSFWLTIFITLPTLAIIPFWWFLEESIHWNISKGRTDEVKKQFRKMAKFNKVKLDEALVSEMLDDDVMREAELIRSRHSLRSDHDKHDSEPLNRQSSQKVLEKEGVRFWDLFLTPRIRYISFALTCLWLANTLCYYGLQMAAELIKNVNFFMSFFILAVVEVPSIIITMPCMIWLGRKTSVILFQVIAGISLLLVAFLPLVLPEGQELILLGMAAFGKFAVCCSFSKFILIEPTCFTIFSPFQLSF